MRTFTTPLLVAALLAPMLGAQVQSKEPGDRKARVAAIKQEFDAAQNAVFERYQKAKDDAERDAIVKEIPKGGAYVARLWPIVDEAAGDDAAADALAWILGNAEARADKNRALGLLLQNHVGAPAMGDVCTSLVYEPSPKGAEFLEKVAAAAKSDDARGKALFSLAKMLGNAIESSTTLANEAIEPDQRKRMEEFFGADAIAWLRGLDHAKTTARVEQLYEEVAAKFTGVELFGTPLAEQAKGELFELRTLAIGKTAPDIVGKDADGVEFKLSDYRGKVVVLDFWGEW
ncbi:MAG: redoxin domain-containing protein [Planctomycetes bacterium]|nr:redoxin domain-containing protein [Planctomycetota bacterium]